MSKTDTARGEWAADLKAEPPEIISDRTVIAYVHGEYAGEDIANAQLIAKAVKFYRQHHDTQA